MANAGPRPMRVDVCCSEKRGRARLRGPDRPAPPRSPDAKTHAGRAPATFHAPTAMLLNAPSLSLPISIRWSVFNTAPPPETYAPRPSYLCLATVWHRNRFRTRGAAGRSALPHCPHRPAVSPLFVRLPLSSLRLYALSTSRAAALAACLLILRIRRPDTVRPEALTLPP